ATKTAAASVTAAVAAGTLIRPDGISRAAVRGFRASKTRSAIRLKPIAAKRAAVNATTTQRTVSAVIAATRDAASTPSSANGSAKRVCGSLTKLSQCTREEVPAQVWPSRTAAGDGGRATTP